jgi:hypothetical protein
VPKSTMPEFHFVLTLKAPDAPTAMFLAENLVAASIEPLNVELVPLSPTDPRVIRAVAAVVVDEMEDGPQRQLYASIVDVSLQIAKDPPLVRQLGELISLATIRQEQRRS